MIPVPTDADIQLQRAFADVENRLNTLEKTPRDQEPPDVVANSVSDERVFDGDTIMDGSLEIGDDLEVLGSVNAPHLYEGLIKVFPDQSGTSGSPGRVINIASSVAIVPGSLSADTVRCRRLDVNEKDSYILPDPSFVSVVDDFIHSGGVTSGTIGELGWTWYKNATATLTHYTVVGHPGCVYITTPNASDIGSIYANPSQYMFLSGVTEYRQVWVMREPTTDVGTMDVRFGIMDNVTYAAVANGIYFELDAGGTSATNWVARTYSASSNTDTDTGVAYSVAGWKKFEIWYTAAAVKFYINGALVATHTTNIPTTTDMMPCWSQLYQTGTGNSIIDYYSMTHKVAR